MDKSCKLFFLSEANSNTAIDDILDCSEQDEDSSWNFRHDCASDLLTVEHSHPFVNMGDVDSRKKTTYQTLGTSPYLNDADVKEESVEARSSCARSFTLDNHENFETSLTADLVVRQLSEGQDCTRSNSEDQTALSNSSDMEGPFEDGTDYSPENDAPIPCWHGSLEQKMRGFQYDLNYSSDEMGKVEDGSGYVRKKVQKPPTTAGIGLEDLKAVFHLERPKAEKHLRLKRTTFSNLSRHFGISKWPFRTIRDAMNRMKANQKLLSGPNLSRERQRKLVEQQRLLTGVIKLIYSNPRESRDSNTLAVLLRMVASRGVQN